VLTLNINEDVQMQLTELCRPN